jgi:hypothetical protein
VCTPVCRFIIAGLVLLAGLLSRAAARQDDPAADMQTLIEAGDAGYLRGDYEAGRQAFEKAWQLVLETAPDNPVRYDILKRLALPFAPRRESSRAPTTTCKRPSTGARTRSARTIPRSPTTCWYPRLSAAA